jgi:hypothetical protein
MLDLRFLEPPTQHSLEEARRSLQTQQQSADEIKSKIQDAEQELKTVERHWHEVIRNLQQEHASAEQSIASTLAYLSPIRRLPHELLGSIFSFIFEEYPCCAWVLSAVCQLWRKQALGMHRLWSRVRFQLCILPLLIETRGDTLPHLLSRTIAPPISSSDSR